MVASLEHGIYRRCFRVRADRLIAGEPATPSDRSRFRLDSARSAGDECSYLPGRSIWLHWRNWRGSRSEERRVGKECMSGWWRDNENITKIKRDGKALGK